MSWLQIWKTYFSNRKNIYLVIGNIFFVVFSLNIFTRFLVFNEVRPYVVNLNDPLFNLFNAIDLNIIAFPLIYVALITFIIYNSFRPRALMAGLTAYALMLWVRIVAMYITPLDVPAGAIGLHDPVVFMLGTGQEVQRDLFFSGHTATLTILALVVFNARKISGSDMKLKVDTFMKVFFLLCLIIVAASVVLQKAHYTIDVFAAPFFAFGVYSFVKRMFGVKN